MLVASGISAQLFATSETPQSSSLEDADPTLYVHGDRLRPLVEETGNAQTLNIYGPGGRIIGQVGRDGSGGQEVRHLLADHLGSTRAGLDSEGDVVAQFEYGPYGKTRAAGTAATKVRYRYTGHPWDESQGLYQTPARGYDPTQGRFLSVDPQRQGASPYVYAGNNPVGFLDPTGGGEVPFFVFTGFKTRESSGGRKTSFTADAVASVFGKSTYGNQHSLSAEMFNGISDSQGIEDTSWAEFHPSRYVGHSAVDYGKMNLFIGGDKSVDIVGHLAQGINAMTRKKPGFAREVTIINFSGDEMGGAYARKLFENAGRKPLLIHAGVETGRYRGGGQRVTKFTSGSVEYSPSEFVAYVHDLEKAPGPSTIVDQSSTIVGHPTTIADHPWIAGETSETLPLPHHQLSHEIPPPQHELTPLGDPPYQIRLRGTPRDRIPQEVVTSPYLPPEPMEVSD